MDQGRGQKAAGVGTVVAKRQGEGVNVTPRIIPHLSPALQPLHYYSSSSMRLMRVMWYGSSGRGARRAW